MEQIRRRSLLSGITASVGVSTGCLGFTDSSKSDDPSGPIDVRIKNRTDGKRALTLRVRRPFGWTPTDSTSTPKTPVTNRELTLAPGAERSLENLIGGTGRFLVTAQLDHENEKPYSSRTTGNLRFDTADATSSQIDVDIWLLEEFPEFDESIPESFPTYYHVEVGFHD
ncbi:MAG: hypothetical protein ABEI99_05995 [Halobaculum sp.]